MTRSLVQWLVVSWMAVVGSDAASQTTAFTYQGRLTENSNPANGAFQMQFKLFDALSLGNQIGATVDNVPVSVAQGIFTTVLDFGAAPLSGADRWLEIGVRHNSGESYTTIAPREQISSAPYAVRTLSAAMADDAQKLGGISANQYLTTTTGIRNQSALQTATFNITGPGVFGASVGIGTGVPSTRLEVVDAARQMRFGPTTADNGGYLISSNPSQAIVSAGARWDGSTWTARDTKTALGAFQSGEIGFFADSNLVVGQGFVPTERMKIDASGNVRQAANTGGLAKAMLFVNNDSTILRCYNGITGVSGSSPQACGFSVVHEQTGIYLINFGFTISGRFFSVSGMVYGIDKVMTFQENDSTSLRVHSSYASTSTYMDNPFMVIVY